MLSNGELILLDTATRFRWLASLSILACLVGCGESNATKGLRTAGYVGVDEAAAATHSSALASEEGDEEGQAGSGAEAPPEMPPPPPVAPEPPPEEDEEDIDISETLSDDSVRCGNGVLDEDELCDIAIPDGEDGACPLECEPLAGCQALELSVRGCWTQCVLGEPEC